jgi:hypothetical protein
MHENIGTGFKIIGIRLIRGFEDEISIKRAQIIANLSRKVDKIGMRIQEVKKDLNNSKETGFDRLFLSLIKSQNEGLVGLLNNLQEAINGNDLKMKNYVENIIETFNGNMIN